MNYAPRCEQAECSIIETMWSELLFLATADSRGATRTTSSRHVAGRLSLMCNRSEKPLLLAFRLPLEIVPARPPTYDLYRPGRGEVGGVRHPPPHVACAHERETPR